MRFFKKLIYATALVLLAAPMAASASGTATLSAGAVSSAAKGSAVSVTISLDTGGTAAFAYQADLSYPAAFFSSASIAMAAGSPFTGDTNGRDPDVGSGGNIHFARYSTTAKIYNGPIATITLQSNGTAGATSLDFKGICANTVSTSNCSAVVNGSNAQLLGSTAGTSISLTTTAAGITASGKTAKASSKKAAAVVADRTTTSMAAGGETAATSQQSNTTASDKNDATASQGDASKASSKAPLIAAAILLAIIVAGVALIVIKKKKPQIIIEPSPVVQPDGPSAVQFQTTLVEQPVPAAAAVNAGLHERPLDPGTVVSPRQLDWFIING